MAAGNPPKKFKNDKADFGEFESFTFKHPDLFEYCTFTFKGYAPGVQKALEDVVTDMSARIDDNFGYLITDHFTFAAANDGRPHYSIAYLAHSIRAKELLDINDYMFVKLKGNAVYLDCHCLDIKCILNAKYRPNNEFQNVKCSLCYEAEALVTGHLDSNDASVVE